MSDGFKPGARVLVDKRAAEMERVEKKAREITKAIEQNVDALYAKTITYEAFSARQREIWSPCDNCRTLNCAVSAILRTKAAA